MIKGLVCAVALLACGAAASAQDQKITPADFVGTWNIEAMSHQIALVVEPGEGNKVTATMMMPMGRDMLLKGEIVERTLTLTGVKAEGAAAAAAGAEHVPPSAVAGATPKPIVIVLQDDGTIVGEMMTTQGPVKWTGEKLKAKKKG